MTQQMTLDHDESLLPYDDGRRHHVAAAEEQCTVRFVGISREAAHTVTCRMQISAAGERKHALNLAHLWILRAEQKGGLLIDY
jgi:hypothetical protein